MTGRGTTPAPGASTALPALAAVGSSEPAGVSAPHAADLAWIDRDAAGRKAVLDAILAQVSREALQGDDLESILQRIVDSLVLQLPGRPPLVQLQPLRHRRRVASFR